MKTKVFVCFYNFRDSNNELSTSKFELEALSKTTAIKKAKDICKNSNFSFLGTEEKTAEYLAKMERENAINSRLILRFEAIRRGDLGYLDPW